MQDRVIETEAQGLDMLRAVRERLRQDAIATAGMWIGSQTLDDAERMVAVVDAWRLVNALWRKEHELPSIPEWMTPEQVQAVHRIYDRGPLPESRAQFFARVQRYGDCAGVSWAGMFVGIEKDGYTHT